MQPRSRRSREEYLDGKGRRGLDSYLNYGYVPLEDHIDDAFHKNEQVSRTLSMRMTMRCWES